MKKDKTLALLVAAFFSARPRVNVSPVAEVTRRPGGQAQKSTDVLAGGHLVGNKRIEQADGSFEHRSQALWQGVQGREGVLRCPVECKINSRNIRMQGALPCPPPGRSRLRCAY